jgi:hypothetical protein
MLPTHYLIINSVMGRPRKYEINEDYFEKINTPSKSYILGFLYADGSVFNGNLSVGLSLKDVEIIDFLISELGFSGSYKKRVINNNTYVILTITSKKLTNDLIKLGVVVNKTYNSRKLPKVPNEFLVDMIRGFFDGDGSIFSNKREGRSEEFTISFSSNIYILDEIKCFLTVNNITSSKIRLRNKNSEYSGMLEIRGSLNIEKFYKLIYNDSFYLKRKYNKILNFIDVINNIKKRRQSEENVNLIKNLYLNGVTQKNIHIETGIPFSTVRGTIQKLRKEKLLK